PLAMACANAVLDVVLEDSFLAHVRETGDALKGRLAELPKRFPTVIEAVRGVGLLLGLKCVVPSADLVTACREAGMLTVPAGDNVVRLLPPLIIDRSHVDAAMAALERACTALSA